MSYLRFSRAEYEALADLCRGLDLQALPPDAFRRALVRSLPGALAARVAGFTEGQLRVLAEHLGAGSGAGGGPYLSGEEFEAFASACAPLLARARFLLPVLGALLEHFKDDDPGLAAKLNSLGHREFEALCEEVKERLREDAG